MKANVRYGNYNRFNLYWIGRIGTAYSILQKFPQIQNFLETSRKNRIKIGWVNAGLFGNIYVSLGCR